MLPTMRSLLLLVALPASASAADWPHWRGENRDGQSAESSRFDEGAWPPGEALWGTEVGAGSGSVVVAGGNLYTMGYAGGQETVWCLKVSNGTTVWRQSYKAPRYGRHAIGDQGFYRGPSSTPEYDPDTQLLYTLGIDGELGCWDTRDKGTRKWALNLYDRFEIPRRPQVTDRPRSHRDYGYPTSPLVFGDWLLVEAGDPRRGNVLCFDKRNGKLLWGSENKDAAGHTGGPVPMTVDGVPCLAVLTARNLIVMRLDGASAGKSVASYPWATDFINNIPCPVVVGQSILVTSRYNMGEMVKLDIALRDGARLAWRSKSPSGVCTPVVHQGRIYFANKGFHCLDLATGREIWEGGRYGDAGSVIFTADERLIAWANDGDLTLVDSAVRARGSYRELSAKRGVLNDMAWPHLVLAGGRLFCKDRGGRIRCLALAKGLDRAVAAADAVGEPGEGGASAPATFQLRDWPGESRHLVLGWKRGGGKRGMVGSLTKAGRWALSPRDGAAFGEDGSIRPGGGVFKLAGNLGGLRDKLVAAGELSIELIFRSDDKRQTGPARILSFSESAYSRNFTLAQEGDQLLLRLRTPRTGDNGMKPEAELCSIEAGVLYHLVIAYRDGALDCYLNGRPALTTDAVRGKFNNWTEQPFVIGNENDGGRPWEGAIEGFALFDKAMDQASATKRFTATSRR